MRIFYRFLNNLNMVDCLMLKFIYDSFFLIFVRFYMNVFINGKLKLCEYINRSFINNILIIVGIIVLRRCVVKSN